RVNVTNLFHTFPADLDVVLVGPQGQKCILMSDAGGGHPGVTGRNYTFDQTAPDFPNTAAASGTYKPFNYAGDATLEPGGIDVFPAPGPGSQNYGVANLDVFNGTNPNGIWRLYVVDDEAGDTGGISTWTIDVTTTTSRLNNLTSDFDGDGRTDLSVWRDVAGSWYTINSLTNTFAGTQFGAPGDRIVPADYDGDGRTDIAVWRPSSGSWYLLQSTAGFTGVQFGAANDLPAPGDYDGDGRADLVVFRPSDGVWYSLPSGGGFTATPFGQNGDKPVPGDYDGDGRTDIAVYRPSAGSWYLLRSTLGFTGVQFGVAADKVMPADYDGDGLTDLAVYRDAVGTWYRLQTTGGFTVVQFGTANDIPAAGDFDGDGKADITVFRPNGGNWYRLNSSNGAFFATQFGQNGDKPVASSAVPIQ
ncbi:MAG: VCBS repeat-containing protein, partial [Pyrinomonadaceae bacterium]